jgi:hypothetical protein
VIITLMGLLRTGCLWIGLLCGCSPALDWRRVRPADFGLEALFPCRPAGLSRAVVVAQRRVEMVMHACAAGGSTFAIGALALDDVRDVDAALVSLRDAAANNLGSVATAPQAVQVPGMTPHAQAGRLTLTGRRPDGSTVVEHLAVFSRGTRVYQATVVGNQPDAEAVAAFFAGLRLTS